MLYTAQYRYSGPDRFAITVKAAKDDHPIGKIWAPTWDLVMGIKNGRISEKEYADQYYELLGVRWEDSITNAQMRVFITTAKRTDVTVVCFCKSGDFCHRYLLAGWLQHNFQVPYGGER
jgi:uncharacterized protein YeaO (DUF488 family)